MVTVIEVYADLMCPFAHVGLAGSLIGVRHEDGTI